MEIDVQIRSAIAADYPAYLELVAQVDQLHAEKAPRYYRLAGQPVRTKDFYLAILNDPKRTILLAVQGPQVLGYAHIESRVEPDIPVLVPMAWANVSDLVVDSAHQRKGVARTLLQAVKVWAREQGCKDLRLSVAGFNTAATELYASEGFQLKHQVLAFPLS